VVQSELNKGRKGGWGWGRTEETQRKGLGGSTTPLLNQRMGEERPRKKVYSGNPSTGKGPRVVRGKRIKGDSEKRSLHVVGSPSSNAKKQEHPDS